MNKRLSKWKFIAIYNDSRKELVKYELNDDERLKIKMKRMKKRSLINPRPMKANQYNFKTREPVKLDFHNEVIFSVNFHDVNDKRLNFFQSLNPLLNTTRFNFPSLFSTNCVTESLAFSLPKLNSVDKSDPPEVPTKKNIVFITDIAADIRTNK